MNNIYYVYAYLRNKDSKTAKVGTPYYIGKGNGRRAYGKHLTSVPKNKLYIIFLKQNLSEADAFEIEKYMIAWYGRKNLKTGILHNQTDGGDGSSGYKHTKEAKNKITIARLGKTRSIESCAKTGEICRKPIITPNGIFGSKDIAAKYYKVSPSTIRRRLQRFPEEYYHANQ